MDGQKLIKPYIFLAINQCPKCFGRLSLLEVDTYVGALNKRGKVIGGQEFTDVSLLCQDCGEEYPAWKKGNYYYIASQVKDCAPTAKDFNPFYTN